MIKNKSENIRKKLFDISVRENVAFQNIQTMFLIERMVARLTASRELFDSIVFKGGYVALRVFNSQRYTVDLDALIKTGNEERIIKKAILSIEKERADGVWFKFEKKSDLMTLGEYGGTRLWFRCGIGMMPEKYYKAQSLHLDLATGDKVYPYPELSSISDIFGEDIISWKIYTVESAVAEKLHTLVVRGSENSRSKDIFDLFTLLPQCSIHVLKEALKTTFKARNDDLPISFTKAVSGIDLFLLEKGWKSATAGLINKITIKEAFSLIVEFCKIIDE